LVGGGGGWGVPGAAGGGGGRAPPPPPKEPANRQWGPKLDREQAEGEGEGGSEGHEVTGGRRRLP